MKRVYRRTGVGKLGKAPIIPGQRAKYQNSQIGKKSVYNITFAQVAKNCKSNKTDKKNLYMSGNQVKWVKR